MEKYSIPSHSLLDAVFLILIVFITLDFELFRKKWCCSLIPHGLLAVYSVSTHLFCLNSCHLFSLSLLHNYSSVRSSYMKLPILNLLDSENSTSMFQPITRVYSSHYVTSLSGLQPASSWLVFPCFPIPSTFYLCLANSDSSLFPFL